MIEQNTIKNPNSQEDQIDLIALAKTAWNGRKTIIKITIIFTIIGLFIAIFTPKQYRAKTILVPQNNNLNSGLGGLSSIAAMAGFNLNLNSGSELNPMIYPQIVQSIPFQKELMYKNISLIGFEDKVRIIDLYTQSQYSKFNLLSAVKQYTIGLPGLLIRNAYATIIRLRTKTKNNNTDIKSGTRDSGIIQLTQEEKDVRGILGSNVYLTIDKMQGYITIYSVMSEPKAAAELGHYTQQLLQKRVTELKLEKAKAKLAFIQGIYLEKKIAYENSQTDLANFNDKNKNVTTAKAKTEEERLRNKNQLAFSIYSELAKQLENSRIQIKEETPIFSVIEPISVPSSSFTPKRKQIIIIWMLLGVIVSIGFLFSKKYYIIIKNLIKD